MQCLRSIACKVGATGRPSLRLFARSGTRTRVLSRGFNSNMFQQHIDPKYAHMLKFDLKAKMSKDIVDALKASDRPRFEGLKAIKNTITEWEKNRGREAKDVDILHILTQRVYDIYHPEEALPAFGRRETPTAREQEAALIKKYLPDPASPEELRTEAGYAIDKVKAKTLDDIEKVMDVLGPRMAGLATLKEMRIVVQESLPPGEDQ